MHDFNLLKYFGSTEERIRQVFTAQEGDDLEIRKRWEKRFMGRIHDGIRFNLNNYSLFTASDLAWDSNTITKWLVPLQMYAQGRIQMDYLKDTFAKLSPETRSQFLKENEKKEVVVDIPKFFEVSYNMVRSMVTRRTAAIVSKYVPNFPFYKYESRSTSEVAKLRADVTSQRIEMITDQYGYRHDLEQATREMLLYPYSVEFVAGAWDVERVPYLDETATPEELLGPDGKPADGSLGKIKSRIRREGVAFARPHPSRVFWDQVYPLSSLNSDTGATFVGYWNVLPYRAVRKNTAFFNRDKIDHTWSLGSLFTGHSAYWEMYYEGPPSFPQGQQQYDLAATNDRFRRAGRYTMEQEDQSCCLTEYFERIIPKDEGLGNYPEPIWVRLVIAGGTTVVYGEFLPDTPAVVYQYNNHDGRVMNNSFSTDIFPYQDQVSNMLTTMLCVQKAMSLKILSCDIDQITNPKHLAQLRRQVETGGIFENPIVWLEYRSSVASEIGQKPQAVVTLSETTPVNDVTMFLRSVAQIIGFAERNLGISANESAQSEPREVSATESANIATTVNTTLAFMSLGIDKAMDARKRIVFNSWMSKGSAYVEVPVANRYLKQTIEAAKFRVTPEEEAQQQDSNLAEPQRYTVIGTKNLLNYEYVFTSREGSERAVNAKAAETLVQLLAQLAQIPNLLQDLGKQQLYALMNEIARLSGASFDLKFEVQDGQGDGLPAEQSQQQDTGWKPGEKEQVIQAIETLARQQQMDDAKFQQLSQLLHTNLGGQPAAPAAPAPEQPQMAA